MGNPLHPLGAALAELDARDDIAATASHPSDGPDDTLTCGLRIELPGGVMDWAQPQGRARSRRDGRVS